MPELLRGGMTCFKDMAAKGKSPQPRMKLVTCDLPADLEVEDVAWNFAADGVNLICYSSTFDVAGMEEIPFLEVLYTQEYLKEEEIGARLAVLAEEGIPA